MGTIGRAKRLPDNAYSTKTPGVGSYNLIGFKCLGKAAESTFDLGQFK
jgi:hypothetical protein